MNETHRSSLSHFFSTLRKYRYTLIYGLSVAGILPLLAKQTNAEPSWPNAITPVTSIVILVTFVITYHSYKRRNRKNVEKQLKISAIGASIFFLIFTSLTSIYTFDLPNTDKRGYAGCGWTAYAKLVATEYSASPDYGCPGQYHEMIKAAGYKGALIWDHISIAVIKMAIFLSWVVAFAFLSYIFSLFIHHHSLIAAPAPRRKPK